MERTVEERTAAPLVRMATQPRRGQGFLRCRTRWGRALAAPPHTPPRREAVGRRVGQGVGRGVGLASPPAVRREVWGTRQLELGQRELRSKLAGTCSSVQ